VLGLGVGYALSCALSEAGYDVVGVDTNPEVVTAPRQDRSVRELLEISEHIAERIKLTTDLDAILDRDIVVICVTTGDEKKLVLGHVENAMRTCLSKLRKSRRQATILVYSTLPFGSSRRIAGIFQQEKVELDKNISYCYMPLMIAQGTTAQDFVNPPFIAFGSYSSTVAERMRDFYLAFVRRSKLFNGRVPPNFVTSPEIAELSKLVANAFLSTKISFANMIARFCETNNIDGSRILEIVGSDWRIGSTMLRPGYAFGGACFPRDLESLIETFQSASVRQELLQATGEENRLRILDPVRALAEVRARKVLILGTAYKAGITDERGSPTLELAKCLRAKGYEVSTYDPNVDRDLRFASLIRSSQVIVVGTNEPLFSSLVDYIPNSGVKAVLDFSGATDAKDLPLHVGYFKAGSGWINKPLTANS